MCGIYGIISFTRIMLSEHTVASRLIEQGKRLEYRGYQSVGMVITTSGKDVFYERQLDGCENMRAGVDERTDREEAGAPLIGLVHTRWPTHGEATIENSQPMKSDPEGEFYVVLNGVIRNHEEIRKQYRADTFKTPTDTEVIARLFKEERERAPEASFTDLCRSVANQCKGRIAIAVVSEGHFPGQMVAYTRKMPLLVGFSEVKTGSDFRYSESKKCTTTPTSGYAEIASDKYAFSKDTKSVYAAKDGDIIHFKERRISISSPLEEDDLIEFEHIEDLKSIKHLHYMEAEIYDQFGALKNVLEKYLKDGSPDFEIKPDVLFRALEAKHFYFLACGTSYNACKAVESMFIELLGIQPHVMLASDFTDMRYPISSEDVYFFVSQSGETNDTRKAQERCIKHGATTVAFTNKKHSSIHEKATEAFEIMAGPEIGVASTKAYTCQYLTMAIFAAFLAEKKGVLTNGFVGDILRLPDLVTGILESYEGDLTEYIFNRSNLLILSRGSGHSIALEGALKILEVTYAAIKPVSTAELAHGTLAVVDKDLHAMVIVPNEPWLAELTEIGVDELITCGCRPFVIVSKSNRSRFEGKRIAKLIVIEDIHPFVQGILSIIPFQLASYHSCLRSGGNPDRPRNLAKCVSV